jgi:F0F1-type ATP synthase membrane subunit b/b'
MKTREEIQASMESGLATSEQKIQSMKADIEAAGDDASDEAKEALAEAETLWERGKAKYEEIANASDEEFEQLRDSAAKHWDEISDKLEAGWASISEKFKGMFS